MPKEVEIGRQATVKVDAYSSVQTRFRANSKLTTAHRTLVDNPAFDAGADAALCQYAADLSDQAVDLNSAASVGFRLRGAVDFLYTMKTFAELPKKRERQPNPDTLQPTEPFRRP